MPTGPQESRRTSRHLQAPKIVPRGPQESRRASRTTPSPVLPKQQQDCQELLLASGGSSHCLSCFYASSVTLGPSSLLENASQSQSMRRPTYSTYPLGRSKKLKGRRLGFQKDAAAEMESPDVDIAAMSKAQRRGRATQCALRVDRALEDEVMLATGALRGAGRNSISGSRARSSIGEAAAHRP